jgi:site-specific recombinase XerC
LNASPSVGDGCAGPLKDEHALVPSVAGELVRFLALDRRTGNLRAVQLLLGHTKIESTVRYLGIEVDDALAIAEQVDV